MTRTETQQTILEKTILDRAPIARQHIAKNLDLADFTRDHANDKMNREELERALFQYAEDAYWNTVTAAEDGDLFLFVEIDQRNINTEDELEEWERALEARYTPVEWRYARRSIDKTVFIVGLSADQVDWAKHHDYKDACEQWLKARGMIHDTDYIDCISEPMSRHPFPDTIASTGKEVA